MSAPARGSISVLGALALLLLAGLVAALAGAGASGIALLSDGAPFRDVAAQTLRDPLTLALCQLLGLVTATGVGVLAAFGSDVTYRDALDVRPVPSAFAVLALIGGFALQFPMTEIANLLAHAWPPLGMSPDQQAAMRSLVRIDSVRDAIVVPLALVAVPAVSEELLFRGLLLPGLERRHGARAGLVLSSLLFGVIHVLPVAIVYATIAGLALGWLRQRTGSVLPSIAMHGAFNAVPVVLPAEVMRIEGFNAGGPGVYHLSLSLVLVSAGVAGLCLYAISRLTDPRHIDD